MLAAPDKTNLPAHSRDVCPWGATCPVHGRQSANRAIHACPFSCPYTTPKAGLLQDHLARVHHLPWWKRHKAIQDADSPLDALESPLTSRASVISKKVDPTPLSDLMHGAA